MNPAIVYTLYLLFNTKLGKQGSLSGIKLQTFGCLGHHAQQEILSMLINGRFVDQDLLYAGIEEISQGARDEVGLLEQQGRSPPGTHLLNNIGP